jgi:hypothetical protein
MFIFILNKILPSSPGDIRLVINKIDYTRDGKEINKTFL